MPTGVAISGDYAYVADQYSGLQVIDISDPTHPVPAGSYDTPARACGVAISGDYAYVADQYSGLQVIDISDPTTPSLAGSCFTPDWAIRVAISGDYTYVADYALGLQVIEVFQRRFDTNSNTAWSLSVDGSDETIVTARLSSTQTDSIQWELSADGGANWEDFFPDSTWQEFGISGSDLLWRSTHLYKGGGINPTCTDLEIEWVCACAACVDIDPDVLNPRSGGRWITAYIELPEGYDPEQIVLATVLLNETVSAEAEPASVGDYDEDGIPDLTVKFSRSEVIGTLPCGEQVEVRVSGDVAGEPFAGADTIRVLMPKIKSPNGGEILEVGIEWVIAWEAPAGYVADTYSLYYTVDGCETWEIIAESIVSLSYSWIIPDLASDNCLVLVEAYDREGVMGYDESDGAFTICSGAGIPAVGEPPTCFALYGCSPNPFAVMTVIAFDVPESAAARVTIYDTRGRIIRRLTDNKYNPGRHEIIWQGVDDAGNSVGSGVYFVRMEAGEFSDTRKMMFLR